MNKFFVKFVPWNEKTLSALINKTIKFSTVYEFNDFNEYRYLGTLNGDDSPYEKEALELLKVECEKVCFLNNLKTLSRERCSEEYKRKITDLIKEGRQKDLLDLEEKRFLQENLAYSSVGIFCVSDIDVFTDDSSQLMFAHYAQNLRGLALIYEISDKSKIRKINYTNAPKGSSGTQHLINWHNGNYEEIDDFLYKSENWNYETEMRLFDRPGITQAENHSIILRAILYTSRFPDNEETLHKINNNIYDNNLIIEKIHPSNSYHYFIMEKDGKTIDFLKNTFTKVKNPTDTFIRKAEAQDVDAMVSLSRAKRLAYEKAQPKFWRYGGASGDLAQRKWFQELLTHKDYLMFIAHDKNQKILGFVIGKLVSPPEVYNPGGLTLMIDDFCVQSEDLWESVGTQLIDAIKVAAKSQNTVQILMVCGAHDHSKRKFLMTQKLSIASEWFVGGI